MRAGAGDAAVEAAGSCGLRVDDVVVLQDANRLVLRLTGCDVVARVAHGPHVAGLAFELDLATRLVGAGAGDVVGAPDPRCAPIVHQHGGFGATLWTWYQPTADAVAPDAYAGALASVHDALRAIEVAVPHLGERVDHALRIVHDPLVSPRLPDDDRAFLAGALRSLRADVVDRGAPEQPVHGEPHPGNVLSTAGGPRIVDLETCCRGPVELDLAHAPVEVADDYPGADLELVATCRTLGRAVAAAWRWDRDDVFPNGAALGIDWLGLLRAELGG